jgi:hypothetical protein
MRRMLMVHRRVSGECESEPVVVDTNDPRVVVIELDDGGLLELDLRELRSAIEDDPQSRFSGDPRYGFENRRLHRYG